MSAPAELRHRHIASLFAETHDVEQLRDEASLVETFPAIERATGDRVEIKTLVAGLDENSYLRFRRNIPLSARLSHPGIQRIRDHGLRGDTTYFIVDALAGERLVERMRRERVLPVAEALRIARECAEALQYTHGQKLVARDLSPSLIVLTKERAVLMAHVGLSVCLTDPRPGPAVMENLGYLAPEMISGQLTGSSSDVYSLGVILFEMLTGRSPFSGNGARELIEAMLVLPRPRPSTVHPVPSAVDDVVIRAMAIDPRDRFPSAAAFAEALSAG